MKRTSCYIARYTRAALNKPSRDINSVMFKTISSLSRVPRLRLCYVLLSLALAPTIDGSWPETTRPMQAPALAPESASALQAQLESILRVASDKKSKGLDQLVDG